MGVPHPIAVEKGVPPPYRGENEGNPPHGLMVVKMGVPPSIVVKKTGAPLSEVKMRVSPAISVKKGVPPLIVAKMGVPPLMVSWWSKWGYLPLSCTKLVFSDRWSRDITQYART